MRIKTKKLIKWLGLASLAMAIYTFIGAMLLFKIPTRISSETVQAVRPQDFYGDTVGEDRVALIDPAKEAFLARIAMIDAAKVSVDLASHAFTGGNSTELLMGTLVEAADRGVKVRIIVDGILGGMLVGDFRNVVYSAANHENIEIRFYEPLNPLAPWTYNNRLHDKMMIVDNSIAIMGGRNLEDRFFHPVEYAGKLTNDRDVVVFSTQTPPGAQSGVIQLVTYYEELFTSPYSKVPVTVCSNWQRREGDKRLKQLRLLVERTRSESPETFAPVDFMAISVPTNKVTLVHNPLTRMNKEPICWYTLATLINATDERVFLQSPYIVPTKEIFSYLENGALPAGTVLFTNSYASTPNIPAYSGYVRHRQELLESGVQIYEYQGPDSVHAKTVIIGNRLGAVGSFNLESRSAYLSTESMLIIDSKPFVQQLEATLDGYFGNTLAVSGEYDYAFDKKIPVGDVTSFKKILIRIVSLLTAPFDHLL